MPYTAEDISKALVERLQATNVVVEDTSGGCGASYDVMMCVSSQFEGKKLLERHRLVNGALAEIFKDIHALSVKKLLTPEQFHAQNE
mmetsp:Transcript_15956/g.30628  ORF Transcript_15956/g.30628 Transcript_15956/m.30628 type:complete len:87 (+) Transcript_15956:122-382(+)|eukprot:CAMPEP_0114246484 /NCGR_PEP_ID=MMETSP0058-20121206/12491_1 /TAXON_ID=36894 /ORGANISM="Pyramimonas parkeae, CCMP726" /LENGTH=86 /DNA_ID=CAMNT_0001359681 /DNA_START=115 /DNA_END=375 /DNA_ORIENTATION=+